MAFNDIVLGYNMHITCILAARALLADARQEFELTSQCRCSRSRRVPALDHEFS